MLYVHDTEFSFENILYTPRDWFYRSVLDWEIFILNTSPKFWSSKKTSYHTLRNTVYRCIICSFFPLEYPFLLWTTLPWFMETNPHFVRFTHSFDQIMINSFFVIGCGRDRGRQDIGENSLPSFILTICLLMSNRKSKGMERNLIWNYHKNSFMD